MGTIVLNMAVIVEIIFALYCIITKLNHEKFRSFIRIGALAAFVFFVLVPVIKWSFRWYGLALLLLIWAVLGVWALVGRKPVKEYKPRTIVRRAIRGILLILIALVPVLIFPQYQPPKVTGVHPVAAVTYTWTDPGRVETFTSKGGPTKINVEFWYPGDGGGPYPLVVFSHGMLGIKISNTSTFLELASNGYVVCSMDHPYNSLFTLDDSGHIAIINNAYLREYQDVNAGKYDEVTSMRLEQKWMRIRIADINFVLNTILAGVIKSGSGAVYRIIDPGKIGLMGHSLGGESSTQVARERNDIAAVVNLDADLAGEYVDYISGKWTLNETPYPVPLLNIFSDTLERLMDAIPDSDKVIAVKHIIATVPQAYAIHLMGTDHMSFTDLPLVSPALVRTINSSAPKAGGQEVNPLSTIEKMNDLVLKFFNTYLKGEGSFSAAGTD